MIIPTRAVECELLARHELVAGVDEVGRGALAGPVCVGVAVVTRATPPVFPAGLRDSKLLGAAARGRLVGPIHEWAAGVWVGSASPREIDAVGIIAALRLAAARAMTAVREAGLAPSAAILDGSHDWLSAPTLDGDDVGLSEVRVEVKGDARCAVVAAASVIAKVHRDAVVAAEPDPGYGWATHKGYGSAGHLAALARLGPSDYHRRSWAPCRTPVARTNVSAPDGMMTG